MSALDDRGVVVTGAVGGIGRALARRMIAEGARVVVTDRDAAAVEVLAQELGDRAVGVPADLASAADIASLVERSREALGEIDVWCGNAGVGGGSGLDAAEQDWTAAWDVNVLAHVRAAQLLVPRWLERGGGRFVVTASAAGLLTMLGSPAYSVTKHGAVAFAEWLSATYRHRGIAVHAICPQGVKTRMYDESGPLKDLLSHDALLAPDDVAEATVTAIADERFLVLPHPEVADYYRARADAPERWLTGMNRLQQHLEARA